MWLNQQINYSTLGMSVQYVVKFEMTAMHVVKLDPKLNNSIVFVKESLLKVK